VLRDGETASGSASGERTDGDGDGYAEAVQQMDSMWPQDPMVLQQELPPLCTWLVDLQVRGSLLTGLASRHCL
jgi:hypothetical protein